MPNPFNLAKKTAIESLSTKTSDNVSWYGDLGWSSIYGGAETGDSSPQKYETYVLESFRKNAVVRACVQEIITSLSEAPIRAYTIDDDGNRKYLVDHPIEQLFKRPNKRDSYVEFLERTGQHYFLGGNSFWEKKRLNNGRIYNLVPLRPDRVLTADVDEDNFPVRFKVRTGKNNIETKTISVDDLVHIPDIDPLNEVFGMPRLISAISEVQADNEATMYVNEVLHNHGSPGTVVAIDSERIRGQGLLERAEARWEEKFGPRAGRGKVAFLPGAHTVKEIGFNLKDLEFKDMRDIARSSICAVFGVDPMIIGVSGRGGTLSGNEHMEARRKLWKQTIIPLIRRWEAAINAFLAYEYGDIYAGFDLTQVAALQESRNEAIKRAREMARTGGATLPEIRNEMGFDSEPDDDALIVISGRLEYVEARDLKNLNKEEVVEEPDEEDSNVEDNEEEDSNATDNEEEEEVDSS